MSSPASPCRRFLAMLFCAASLALFLPAATFGQDRRSWATPGLILDTGARTATCDQLMFSADGSELLATGDDKVVRTWNVGATRFLDHHSKTLRWPIFREQRGGIYAFALSPKAKRLVVGGNGMLNGYLAVINRSTGDIEQALTKPPTSEVVWSIAWSPSGRYVVYGAERGSVFRWDVEKRAKTSVRFAGSGGAQPNRVRLVAFLDDNHFISVAQDGIVREWDVNNPKKPARQFRACRLPNIFRVEISDDRRWLAATGEGSSQAKDGLRFELIDLKKLRSGGNPMRCRRAIEFPQVKAFNTYPRALSFDPAGERLAVGVLVAPEPEPGMPPFAKISGGVVHIFSVTTGEPISTRAIDLGYRVERIAFRPGVGHENQIATAGGNNHEVRLWDINRPSAPLDTIRSPGSCLWGVGMSGDRYLAWKEERASYPTPTKWGAGDWRILNLKKHRIETTKPEDFTPVEPLASLRDWSIEATLDGFVWNVVCPDGSKIPLDDKSGLYLKSVNQIPRCYTFLAPTKTNKVIRLAVGHTWGISLYELRPPHNVRLARLMVGHEGEVMAVAPAANGQLLVSASRDQTLAG